MTLDYQYRMNEHIMLLCNSIIYNHQLKCGSRKVAESLLYLPSLASLLQTHHEPWAWIPLTLDPTRPALFLNTDEVSPVFLRVF